MDQETENRADVPVSASGEVFTKVAQLYPTVSIWEVSLNRTREQKVNANVMDAATFELLTKTIKEEGALESLPFGIIDYSDQERPIFDIISGHHRTRAARAAGETRIFVLVSDRPLSADEVVQKQLAHNAITGKNDDLLLKQLYDRIENVNSRIKSGIRAEDLAKSTLRPVSPDPLQFAFTFKSVKFLFLNTQLEKLDRAAASISPDDVVLVCDMEQLDEFTATLRKLSQVEGIRNGGALVSKMVELTLAYVDKQLSSVGGEAKDTKAAAGAAKPKAIGFAQRGEKS